MTPAPPATSHSSGLILRSDVRKHFRLLALAFCLVAGGYGMLHFVPDLSFSNKLKGWLAVGIGATFVPFSCLALYGARNRKAAVELTAAGIWDNLRREPLLIPWEDVRSVRVDDGILKIFPQDRDKYARHMPGDSYAISLTTLSPGEVAVRDFLRTRQPARYES